MDVNTKHNDDLTSFPETSRLLFCRIRIARRILWWIGLLLQLPTIECWTNGNILLWFFRNYPTPVEQYSGDEYSRLAIAVLIGYGCWALVIILRIISTHIAWKHNLLLRALDSHSIPYNVAVCIVSLLLFIVSSVTIVLVTLDVSDTPM